MDEKTAKMEKLSSAAAFVEGGVQDACDDACSICLEAFCDSDPSTVATSLSAAFTVIGHRNLGAGDRI
jgi:hypothetical protein